MATQRLKTLASQILNRLPAVKGRGEEATKQALILPMLDALGYDIWNPAEVCPEYNADFAIKKLGQKEKVDLAVLLEDVPRIYIEVKAVDVALNGHEGQLARYFNATPSVSLAILTNGIEYRFFTDTGDPNIMDQTPFYTVKLDSVDQGLEILARFNKSIFSSPVAIRDFATELNYHRLSTELGLTQEQIADRSGKSRPVVANFMRIRRLPDRIRDSIYENRLTMGHAKVLAGLKNPAQQIEAWQVIMTKKLSVRETESLIRHIKTGNKKPKEKVHSQLLSIHE